MCEYCDVAKAVIRGEYGDYPERKYNLENEGYPYDIIQSMVNKMLDEYPNGNIPDWECF